MEATLFSSYYNRYYSTLQYTRGRGTGRWRQPSSLPTTTGTTVHYSRLESGGRGDGGDPLLLLLQQVLQYTTVDQRAGDGEMEATLFLPTTTGSTVHFCTLVHYSTLLYTVHNISVQQRAGTGRWRQPSSLLLQQVLQYTAVHYSTLQYSRLQYTIVYQSTLKYITVHYTT